MSFSMRAFMGPSMYFTARSKNSSGMERSPPDLLDEDAFDEDTLDEDTLDEDAAFDGVASRLDAWDVL